MSDRFVQLSRMIAFALRHHPERFGLELDTDGWVGLDALVRSIARESKWASLSRDDVFAMLAAAGKQRYEIRASNIRAIYGHSFAGKIEHAPAVPPDRLYHGTTSAALMGIRRNGLKPMRRQYVHLSLDAETAATVARRRKSTPVIMLVNAREAYESGVSFYHGSDQVWLAGEIAPHYLSLSDGRRFREVPLAARLTRG